MQRPDAKAEYTEAKRLHAAGRHAEALAKLDILDAVHPDSKNVLLARAECLLALDRRDAARDLCDRVLLQHDDARARRIREACAASAPVVALLPEFSSEPPPAIPPPLPARKRAWRRIAVLTVLLFVGGIAIALALESRRRQLDPGVTAAAPTQQEFSTLVEGRKTRRAQEDREAETSRAEAARVARARPGYLIPQAEWELDPSTGAPQWRPGIYDKLPLPGTWDDRNQSTRTLDVYVPLAYEKQPEELFPTLAIFGPEGSPGFLEYSPWAEKNNLILISVNSSCNECGGPSNSDARTTAFEFIGNSGLRVHPTLNFSTGLSGGAQAAWLTAYRWSDSYSGVLMIAQGGFRDYLLPPHIRVAYVNGREDFNAGYIVDMLGLLRANGNDTRHQVIPGGHIQGPAQPRIAMLDWLLSTARRDLLAEERATESGN